mgnify:CR=1 FL=1
MVLTYDQRIALLAKAREAKKAKKEQADALKPIPVKGRPKKVLIAKDEDKDVPVEATKVANHTLDLVDASAASANLEIKDEEIKDMIKPSEEEVKEIKKIKNIGNSKKVESQIGEPEPEIIEEVEIRKIKKPKKRIIRKIIKQQYDSDSTEEEYEEVVYEAPKVPKNSKRNNLNKESIKKEVAGAAGAAPKEEVKKSVFNLFSY